MSRPPDAKEALFQARILENLDLCDIIPRQMSTQLGRHVTHEDLNATAREALTIAARDYDENAGVPFRRFANMRIKFGLIDDVRKRGPLPKRVYRALRAYEAATHVQDAMIADDGHTAPASSEEADAKLGSYLDHAAIAMATAFLAVRAIDDNDAQAEADRGERPDETAERRNLEARLDQLIEELPEQERHFLRCHYFEEKTITEAGKELGLSKSWSSRLHARAIESLSRKFRAR